MCAHPLALASAYGGGGDGGGAPADWLRRAAREPPMTTWKFRGDDEKRRCIDFVWFAPSRGLRVRACWALPTPDALGAAGLPSGAYPSDHLALAAAFAWA
jgi:hypothetical protein